jgi:uncharacterized repeat protein (TIGR03987 family)
MAFGISFIFMACLFYTIGVWAEKIKGKLKWWHTIVFWCGFASDTVGTGAMYGIAGNIFRFNFHGVTGMIAIILMLFHALWATIVLLKKDEKMILNFHKFSIVVWCIWLIPMISGMIFGSITGATVNS